MKRMKEADVLNESDPASDVRFLRGRISELEADLREQKRETGEAMEISRAIGAAVRLAVPRKVQYKPIARSESPCVHVLHLTDIHYGMVTQRDEVDGFGEYSPQIAESRMDALTRAIIDKTIAQRHGYNVPELHIIGTADYISGDIHQELQVTNAFPAPVQAVRCGYLLGGMLAAFAPHFQAVSADLVTLDNHGRITRKPQSAQGGLNNWGFVVAEVARQHVASLSNVTVRVHSKPSALVRIGPESYLAFHGHQIKAWAGIPYYGLDRRTAMEAVKRMGLPDVGFTRLLSGHLHHAVDGMYWRTGGSVSGTDAHDHNVGRKSKPHQMTWFVHPKHGEFDFTRWWL
jgi:hypothetical protein